MGGQADGRRAVIAEAIDAATAVGLALLVWIVLAAVFATAVTFAVAVAGWAAWQVLSGAWTAVASFRTLSRRRDAIQGSGGAPDVREARAAAEPPSRPTWARTDTEEAA
jgi:hypothetical protein